MNGQITADICVCGHGDLDHLDYGLGACGKHQPCDQGCERFQCGREDA
jgi:hypothetical protein